MGKVTFKFDEDGERDDINIIVNRHKLMSAFYEIQNLRRTLYKGYYNPEDYVSILVENQKPVRLVTEEEFREANSKGEPIRSIRNYVDDQFIIDQIDRALSGICDLLD